MEYEKTTNPATNPLYRQQNADKYKQVQGGELSNGAVSWTSGKNGVNEGGRFPANVILTYDKTDYEEVVVGLGDCGSASRYFYCAKASKKDRDEGLDDLETQMFHRMRPDADPEKLTGLNKEGRFAPVPRKNIHPTVKPTQLMQYIVRLVTPKGGIVLDPFMGSGSTGKAVMLENRERNVNYKFVGIELTDEYLPICKARIDLYAEKEFTDDYINLLV